MKRRAKRSSLFCGRVLCGERYRISDSARVAGFGAGNDLARYPLVVFPMRILLNAFAGL
jgi:hypothetical protein